MDAQSAEQDTARIFSQTVVLESGITVEQTEIRGYLIDFHRGGPVLAVTFETAGLKIDRNNKLRDGWGLSFLIKLGYSVVSLKPRKADWYRGSELHRWFRSDEVGRFLAGFDDRIFMGSSMGGFAAICFASVTPGALVIAHNPQSTLNPEVVPWEQRFPEGRQQNWRGDFADAANYVQLARKVYMTFDPLYRADSKHAARLQCANVEHLKMPFLGHETPEWLRQLGILKQSTEDALNETLTSVTFARMIRSRRRLPRYYRNALITVRKRKHLDAVLFDAIKQHNEEPEFFQAALVRLFEKRAYRKYLEIYYGRLSLSDKLPDTAQGILRAYTGLVCIRHDPGKFEPKLRKERRERIAKLTSAIDFTSVNPQELMLSARFMHETRNWEKAKRLLQVVLKIEPGNEMAIKMHAVAERKYAEATHVLTFVEKIKRVLKRWW